MQILDIKLTPWTKYKGYYIGQACICLEKPHASFGIIGSQVARKQCLMQYRDFAKKNVHVWHKTWYNTRLPNWMIHLAKATFSPTVVYFVTKDASHLNQIPHVTKKVHSPFTEICTKKSCKARVVSVAKSFFFYGRGNGDIKLLSQVTGAYDHAHKVNTGKKSHEPSTDKSS